jgi:hypothetical protein
MHRRLEQADCQNEGEYRNRGVYAKPRYERSRGFAQREKTLGDEPSVSSIAKSLFKRGKPNQVGMHPKSANTRTNQVGAKCDF